MQYRPFVILLLLLVGWPLFAKEATIRISTEKSDLILKTAPNGRLYQAYLGTRLLHNSDIELLSSNSSKYPKGWEVYPVSGTEDYFEPALAIQHNDGNMTSYLYYQEHKTSTDARGNIEHTTVKLADTAYPLEVTLHYEAYKKENIIKSWSEIKHKEKKAVDISRFASSMLYFENEKYVLTEYSGDWAKEAEPTTQELSFGKKIIDTKLGARAAMFAYPFFQLGLNQAPQEEQGEVLVGTLGWTGNFRFTFEVDNASNLRVISGINPDASTYLLEPNEVFTTPEFIFTLSNEGVGKASRDLHDWARRYQVKEGMGDRYTLLNNWEATFFDFDEPKLAKLMGNAKELGVDLFLLDDGWFGNKYPRASDNAGLGDWEVTKDKLPQGVPGLVKAADKAGIKFGIWIEPEMVNPKSELFEKHPDWVITQPNRELYYFRNQLVLDLSNPKVQDCVYGIVEGIVKENPTISYFKWDCNSPITNIYSPYLKDKQSHIYIEYTRGLYRVLERIEKNYPHLTMMMCSGGGARCDYEALKYYTEFWCSDNTDPIDRIFIQWNFSKMFPVKTMGAHVTSWNSSASIKFRTDVAMMCKLGFDINMESLRDDERTFCTHAVSHYNRLKPVILDGDLYRLVSPYESNHSAVMHVAKDKSKAVLYSFDLYPRSQDKLYKTKLNGLDPHKRYKVTEINIMPNSNSQFSDNNKVYSGDYLMKVGLSTFTNTRMNSRMIEVVAQ